MESYEGLCNGHDESEEMVRRNIEFALDAYETDEDSRALFRRHAMAAFTLPEGAARWKLDEKLNDVLARRICYAVSKLPGLKVREALAMMYASDGVGDVFHSRMELGDLDVLDDADWLWQIDDRINDYIDDIIDLAVLQMGRRLDDAMYESEMWEDIVEGSGRPFPAYKRGSQTAADAVLNCYGSGICLISNTNKIHYKKTPVGDIYNNPTTR